MKFATRDCIQQVPEVYLMIGPPRSGKSIWVNAHRGVLDATIVSADDIRRALGIEFDPKFEGRVWGTFNLMCKALIGRGQNLVVDNGGATVAERKPWVKMAKEGAIELRYVRVEDPPVDEWKRRCTESNFPWKVVEEFLGRREELTVEELAVGEVIPAWWD
jgi:predicted kinase